MMPACPGSRLPLHVYHCPSDQVSAASPAWPGSSICAQLRDGVAVRLGSTLCFHDEAVKSRPRFIEIERKIDELWNTNVEHVDGRSQRSSVISCGEDGLSIERLLVVARYALEPNSVVGAFLVNPAELARRRRNALRNTYEAQKFEQARR